MVECGICLEEYQESDLELHRQVCEVRLMFRCSLCDGDYVNKEGLWNHLDLHDIADEIKELHYQEIKAKHKLHQCVLCNDQRAYSEISYWKHVHDVHDDFFLKCSDCGENFRSEKLKNDHASSRCKVRDPMEEEQVPIEDGNMTVHLHHKLNCPKHSKEHDDSQFSTENISLLHGVSDAQADSTIVAQGEIIDVKLEIEVEETLLQEQDFQVPNQNPERSSATTLKQAHAETQKHTKSRYECVKSTEKFICITLYKHHTNVCDPVQKDSSSHNSSGELILKDKSDSKEAVEKNHKTGAEVTRPANLIELGYVPVKTCSIEDGKLFVKNFEFGFGLHSESISKKGSMRYYRCLRFKFRVHPQCARKVVIYTPNVNAKSTVCVKGEHSCINAPPENMAVPAKINFGYAPVKTCAIEDAKSFVENFEFGFCNRSEKIGKKARMQYYRCSRVKKGARPQCERRVLICTPYTNEESTVYAKGEHCCMIDPPVNLIPAQTGFGYALVKTCSFEDAKSFVKKFEFGFSFIAESDREKGKMRYYRCSRIKRRARPQCERKLFICTPNKNEESTVCVKGEHSCINAPPESLTLAEIDFGYSPIKTCSIEDAKSFVKNFEFGFRNRSEKIGKKARMLYYRCLRVKKGAQPQCERKVLICTPYANKESTVCAKGEHSCLNAPPEKLICVKAKPSVEQADIIIKSGVTKKNVKDHPMLLRTRVSKNRLHT